MTVAILGGLGIYLQENPVAGSSLGGSKAKATSIASTSSQTASSNSSASGYKDGTFTGSAADTPYGVVKIAIVVSGGKISDVNFLQMPSDQGHSREVTAYAEPLLKQNTLSAQSANIQFVSGATDTSYGYQQSLQAAIDQAVQTGQGSPSSSSTGSSSSTSPNQPPSNSGPGIGGGDE